MRRYLIVAHKTLIGEHLLHHVKQCMAEGPCQFHLVVPVTHPAGHAWTEGEAQAAGRQRLDDALAACREIGADVDGEVGDANPVYATTTALRDLGQPVDEIIVSTLPKGVSAWLHVDAVSRIKKEVDLPVTHLEAATAEVTN